MCTAADTYIRINSYLVYRSNINSTESSCVTLACEEYRIYIPNSPPNTVSHLIWILSSKQRTILTVHSAYRVIIIINVCVSPNIIVSGIDVFWCLYIWVDANISSSSSGRPSRTNTMQHALHNHLFFPLPTLHSSVAHTLRQPKLS